LSASGALKELSFYLAPFANKLARPFDFLRKFLLQVDDSQGPSSGAPFSFFYSVPEFRPIPRDELPVTLVCVFSVHMY